MMENKVKRWLYRYFDRIVLAGVLFLTLWIAFPSDAVWGAEIDWLTQHSVFPDYFRRQFYETGSLVPNFAFQLGGGQNIYNFAYYGLLSPAILPSYLLPFVPMAQYIIAVSIAGLLASGFLMQYWLKKKGYSVPAALAVSCMYILASPMILHSFKHIMFVNYMPFLMMAFIGVDRHFQKRKSGLLCIGVFLMIMSSFYFSVGGILALMLYALSVYFGHPKEKSMALPEERPLRHFIREALRIMLPVGTAVLMSAVLWLPILCTLTGGGRSTGTSESILSYILPQFKKLFAGVLFQTDGAGLSTIAVTALFAGIVSKKKGMRILAVGVFIALAFPVVKLLLNGGLYVRDKALIPFLPVLCLLIAELVHRISIKKERKYLACFVLTIVAIGLTMYYRSDFLMALMAVSVLLLTLYLVLNETWLMRVFLPVLGVFSVVSAVYCLRQEQFPSREYYQEIDNAETKKALKTALDQEQEVVRFGEMKHKSAAFNRIYDSRQWMTSVYSSTQNQYYQDFLRKGFQVEQPHRNILMNSTSSNPIFLKMMGVKYLHTDKPPIGYRPSDVDSGTVLYRSDSAAPIGYVTEHVISEQDYSRLAFPYNQEVFLRHAVAENASESTDITESRIASFDFSLPKTATESISLTPTAQGYTVSAQEDASQTISLPEPVEEDGILYVQMEVTNHKPDQDMLIALGGVKNKLTAKSHPYYNENKTFCYAINVKAGQGKIQASFSKGDYEITGMQGWFLPASAVTQDGLYQEPWHVRWADVTANGLSGTVDASQDGYLITSIPYDDAFTVLVDGRKAKPEKVNTAFLGVKLSSGTHEITVHYRSPGYSAGLAVTGAGICVFFIWILWLPGSGHKRKPKKGIA